MNCEEFLIGCRYGGCVRARDCGVFVIVFL